VTEAAQDEAVADDIIIPANAEVSRARLVASRHLGRNEQRPRNPGFG